jgi:hypothetical protein
MTEQNMNEQIRELAERAGAVTFGGKICLFGDHDIEKFAELIVRECARIVPDTDLGDVDGGDSAVLRAASKQIREHFGVEE